VLYSQLKGDSAFIVNGRMALSDIDLGTSGAKATLAIWARNLLNEEHIFYKSGTATSGVTGFFNDPRTFGFDFTIKM
jgi:iron complex outermembrane receptor protein